ncbi:MAG: 4a-hydroxytetrahydrobiopterin dehydratase [Methanobacteriaceae archaeon]|nr:4a-hydroxytetrahydrobiopterin dehydratase [Methanobacteriaceae archaeon]MDP2835973.1 4a-hydroxytetrahydrobiopterin dehydratase [Methanobacteriaceae archaeon]MDP3033619.1 4a-hydroxytetrahydrobiopterin dehydratase [Methanobacteriaceae archaeon]MDP3484537.1 4a-hydroxytetrahydrobiopterin dehydratase [Methanobacteriaceae archaeon]MDP3624282.1 4a-hydroxytetrahydrobiopterin dehydratase [Methanobacteriaceae archaeon]
MKNLKLLKPAEIKKKASGLENWQVIDNHHLLGTFYFNDLAGSMHLAVKVGRLAEEMHHDPEMSIGAGKVELSIFTHDIGGLTDLDFEFAQRVEDMASNI